MMREEARAIVEAASRAAHQMALSVEVVRGAHEKIKALESENMRLREALGDIANNLNLTGSGRMLVASDALKNDVLLKNG